MDTNTGNNFSEEDIKKNKAMAVLSYFGILVLIPIFSAKESPFARYHANQGLVLCIINIAITILSIILSAAGIPFVGTLLNVVSLVVWVFEILGIIQAAKGEAKPLPVIGGIQILK